jgi:hypothetical protein
MGRGLLRGLGNLDLDENMNDELHRPQQPSQPSLPKGPDTGGRRLSRSASALTPHPIGHVAPAPTPSRGTPPACDGSPEKVNARGRTIATQSSNFKAKFLRTLSDTGLSSTTGKYRTLTEKMQNDGTTALAHNLHAFRYINLFFPISGGISDPLKLGPVPSSTEDRLRLFPGMRQAALVTHRGVMTMKLKFDNLEQLRAARLTGWRKGWLPQYPPNRGPVGS